MDLNVWARATIAPLCPSLRRVLALILLAATQWEPIYVMWHRSAGGSSGCCGYFLVSSLRSDTLVATQLIIRASLPDGRPYTNRALQVVRLKWGHIVEDYVYEDTYVLVNALEKMAQQGVAEAKAAPIAA